SSLTIGESIPTWIRRGEETRASCSRRQGRLPPGAEERGRRVVGAGGAQSVSLSPVRKARISHKCQYNSEAGGIRGVLTDVQNRIIVEQAIKDVQRLPGATRNHFGAKDRVLVRDMGVNADGLLVIAVIPRIIGCQKTTRPYPKPLRIRRGEGAGPMDGAQGQR